jgi:DNA-binding NarL/FixJ family response regulator
VVGIANDGLQAMALARELRPERQAEVLRLVALGLTYQEVAEQLWLSERTVPYQMTKITDRLHRYNRAQVLAYAGSLRLKPQAERKTLWSPSITSPDRTQIVP